MALVALASCTPAQNPVEYSTTTATTPAPTVDETVAEPSECRLPAQPNPERLTTAYNRRNVEELERLVGQGPVTDPALDTGTKTYASIEDWLLAAETVGDTIIAVGYSPLPLRLYVERRNSLLSDLDIDLLSATLSFESRGACQVKIEVSDLISEPDPCAFPTQLAVAIPKGCEGPFQPRHSHVAVWTGTELLVFGGASSTSEAAPLRSGTAIDPVSGVHRELPDSPVTLEWWPRSQAIWTGEELAVIGRLAGSNPVEVVVALFDPEADGWRVSAPRPTNQWAIGAAVWTGSHLLLVGGDTNDPRNSAWAYDPDADDWGELSVPPFHPVEGIQGVWTGNEAMFIGGYPAGSAAAYEPLTGTWRRTMPLPSGAIEGHSLVWTGTEVIVAGGHGGPLHHETLEIYDPQLDEWSSSPRWPTFPRERSQAVWTGTEVIMWGGYATYGPISPSGSAVHGDGVAYNPASNEWRLISESPLSPRCDHTTTWASDRILVFGGLPRCGDPGVLALGDAATYDPLTDSWRLLDGDQ